MQMRTWWSCRRFSTWIELTATPNIKGPEEGLPPAEPQNGRAIRYDDVPSPVRHPVLRG